MLFYIFFLIHSNSLPTLLLQTEQMVWLRCLLWHFFFFFWLIWSQKICHSDFSFQQALICLCLIEFSHLSFSTPVEVPHRHISLALSCLCPCNFQMLLHYSVTFFSKIINSKIFLFLENQNFYAYCRLSLKWYKLTEDPMLVPQTYSLCVKSSSPEDRVKEKQQ